MTINDAALYLGITRHTLEQLIRKGRLTPDDTTPRRRRFLKPTLDAYAASRRVSSKGLPAETWAAIERRYLAGETAEQLAPEYRITAGHIRNRLGPAGRNLSARTWAEILRRRHAGELVVDLAREYGIAPSTIYNRVHTEKRAG